MYPPLEHPLQIVFDKVCSSGGYSRMPPPETHAVAAFRRLAGDRNIDIPPRSSQLTPYITSLLPPIEVNLPIKSEILRMTIEKNRSF